jgi:hypothetical protein
MLGGKLGFAFEIIGLKAFLDAGSRTAAQLGHS